MDKDWLFLADSVDAVNGLGLQSRIPMHIENEEMIGADQIEPDAAGAKGEEEDGGGGGRGRRVEFLNDF